MVEKKSKKTYLDRSYDLSEDEMQSLVTRAQDGDGPAQMKLLEVFENFLTPYLQLLYYGKYNLSSYVTRRFLALFVPDPSLRFFLLRNKLNPAGIRQLNSIIRGLTGMVQRYGDIEDVEQTINLAFLECVQVYKPKESAQGRVPFSGYIYSYYYYVLKKKVEALLIDQLGRKTFPLIADELNDDEERPPGFTAPPEPGADQLIFQADIDEFWVTGDTATGVFAHLTTQERQLLRWRYADNERSSDIAYRITEHPNTTREHLSKIRAKLREHLVEQGKLED